MPQNNKKVVRGQHYKKKLKVFLPKNSGWYICKAMGHTLEVHLQNYSRFIPDGTSEMYDKTNNIEE